jgi:hypothetical protein
MPSLGLHSRAPLYTAVVIEAFVLLTRAQQKLGSFGTMVMV